MGKSGLRASSRLVEADWLAPRLRHFSAGVAAVVPDGFAAYARILHPARGRHDQPVPWAAVARESGGIMHRLVQFHAIHKVTQAPSEDLINRPETGNLPAKLLVVLCETLAQHTGTPDDCYFCAWEGYGWLHDSDGGRGTLVFMPIGAEAPLEPPSPATLAEPTVPPAVLSAILSFAVRGSGGR